MVAELWIGPDRAIYSIRPGAFLVEDEVDAHVCSVERGDCAARGLERKP